MFGVKAADVVEGQERVVGTWPSCVGTPLGLCLRSLQLCAHTPLLPSSHLGSTKIQSGADPVGRRILASLAGRILAATFAGRVAHSVDRTPPACTQGSRWEHADRIRRSDSVPRATSLACASSTLSVSNSPSAANVVHAYLLSSAFARICGKEAIDIVIGLGFVPIVAAFRVSSKCFVAFQLFGSKHVRRR